MAQPLADIEGKYEIVAKIKEGGMGAIYRVRHRLLDEIRVVKVLRPQHEDDDELRARFAREARSAIRLRHPNVVQIFDFSVDEAGAGLIVMEFIEGVDLEQLVRLGRLPSLPLALEVARQSLRALGFLHGHGFVHRDVSPDNLMLTRDVDGLPLIKLIDLGIAKRLDAEQQLTVSGSFLGKFRYASPEHFGARGADGLDRRSDLYSFGLVLYELLTGHYPLAAASTSQLIGAHLFHTPRPFAETDPAGRVPEAVRVMVLRALEKTADARPADAEVWIEEIERLQQAMAPAGDLLRLRAQLQAEAGSLVAGGGRPVAESEVGSTQRRLDRGFLLQTTPSPSEAEAGALRAESSVGAAADADALSALVEGARALGRIGHLQQARRQLETVLALDPDHADARRAVAEIGAGPAAQGTAPPPTPTLPPIPSSAKEAEGTVRRLLAKAEEHLDQEEYEAALELLQAARDRAPGQGSVVEQLARGVARLDARLQERERGRAIEQIERHVLAAMQQGKLGHARRDIQRARDAYGDDPVFDTLDQILDGADAERRRAERSQVSSGGLLAAVAEVERLRMEQGPEAARHALDEAILHFGEASLLLEVRAGLEAADG
jgi:serine/threonine-protein kinase